MDINSIKDQVSNLSLYDLKAGVRKVQNGPHFSIASKLPRHVLTISPSCNELYRDGSKGTRILDEEKSALSLSRSAKQQIMSHGAHPPQSCKTLPMAHTASERKCYVASSIVLIWGSQLLNEIMPMIYKRFTEKAAEEWRQIYKVAPLAGIFDDCH